MQAKTLLSDRKILDIASDTLRLESKSILQLTERIGQHFVDVVKAILANKGRVVVSGIGKSAIIGQKIVATLNSTGTPSLFMHAADAIHGDLGMIQKQDLIICISKSGESPEIKALIPLLKQGTNPLVALTGNLSSTLAMQANWVLDTRVEKEACPNNLAPTTSTAAQLAMGDALAVALLSCREFSQADFAKFHPGGSLGKKIYLRLSDLSHNQECPTVKLSTELRDCIIRITEGRMGAVVVLDNEEVKGIITDGDLRRMLYSGQGLDDLTAKDIMTKDPFTVDYNTLAVKGVEFINDRKINHLITTKNGLFDGLVHIQDLMREGLL